MASRMSRRLDERPDNTEALEQEVYNFLLAKVKKLKFFPFVAPVRFTHKDS